MFKSCSVHSPKTNVRRNNLLVCWFACSRIIHACQWPVKNLTIVFIYRFQGWSYCSELALHVESEMIVFTSRLFIFLSDDNGPRSASFSSSKFFLFLNFTRGGHFFSKDTWKLNRLSSPLSSGIWPPPLWNFQFSLCWAQYYAEHCSRKAQIALVLKWICIKSVAKCEILLLVFIVSQLHTCSCQKPEDTNYKMKCTEHAR